MLNKIINKIVKILINNGLYKIINLISFHYEVKRKSLLLDKFKNIGYGVVLPNTTNIINPQYINIGNNFFALGNLRIEAWDSYYEQIFSPEIIIGNDVILNTDIHIGCINRVVIGNNVLMASRIYISDHSHGEITINALNLSPAKRPLVSKGPVIIEDNVWIGEGVSILPGVTIGRNSIILSLIHI